MSRLPKNGILMVSWALAGSGKRPKGKSGIFHWVAKRDEFIFESMILKWLTREEWEIEATACLRSRYPDPQELRIWGAIDIGA